jgi:2-C-methyl-D-erythritol 2,4-cyclodiphosphate synthase
MRIGHGYDVHRFGPGDKLMLGGVTIPYKHSFVAHSDGDVLIHALIDSLLGAAALGDIGQHFPDTDSRWQGANSRQLLLLPRSRKCCLIWIKCASIYPLISAAALIK